MRSVTSASLLITLVAATPITAAQVRPAAPTTKQILIVYQHDINAPGAAAFTGQLKAVLREQFPSGLEIYDEYLDLDRFPIDDRAPELMRYLGDKYQGFRPDAIVTEGVQALRFARDYLVKLFPQIPIVYGLAFEPAVDFASLSPQFTGRQLPLPFAKTFDLARKLHPDAERVVLVAGSSSMDSLLLADGVRQIRPLLNRMELRVLRDWSYSELLDSVRRLPPRTFVLASSFQRDRSGQEFNTGDVIGSVAKVSSVPMYGIARNWVGDGIVGGAVMHFGDDGHRVAQILLQVLARKPNESLPKAEIAPTPLVVDWRQLQRWGLSENQLPPGSEVVFRTPSLWERHGGAILTVLAVLAFESLLIALLLLERRRRVRAQRAVESQVEYERLMAALTADMVRRAPAETPAALEDALPRIARFAGASAAVLVTRDDTSGAVSCLVWTAALDRVRKSTDTRNVPPVFPADRLELPLVVEELSYGTLELHRAPGIAWPPEVVTRLQAVSDRIAGALDRARAGRVLEQTRGQVEHMARVATVSGLAAAVSHELRQPLTAIRMNAAAGALFLARTPPELDEARIAFSEIARDDERASEVIEHFRSLLLKRDPINTTVDLSAVCRHTAKLVEHEAFGRDARLILNLDDEAMVRGDPVQLQQAVINLTLNALDALSGSSAHREAIISTARNNHDVEVHVADSGPGLPPDVKARLFEPFFSTKPHGLGLGLTIVRTIVERHQGRLRGENRSGGGAVFTMILPAEDSRAGAA